VALTSSGNVLTWSDDSYGELGGDYAGRFGYSTTPVQVKESFHGIALRWLPFPMEWLAPVRFLAVMAVLLILSRSIVRWRLWFPAGSVLVGLAVLAIWIAPETLWHGYREFWLFHNRITGVAASTLPPPGSGNRLVSFCTEIMQ
jgi:hypothetical protein